MIGGTEMPRYTIDTVDAEYGDPRQEQQIARMLARAQRIGESNAVDDFNARARAQRRARAAARAERNAEPGTGADVLSRMMVEIMQGVAPEESAVLTPSSESQRRAWDRLSAEIAAARERGEIIRIPAETPSLDGYEEGRAPGLRSTP